MAHQRIIATAGSLAVVAGLALASAPAEAAAPKITLKYAGDAPGQHGVRLKGSALRHRSSATTRRSFSSARSGTSGSRQARLFWQDDGPYSFGRRSYSTPGTLTFRTGRQAGRRDPGRLPDAHGAARSDGRRRPRRLRRPAATPAPAPAAVGPRTCSRTWGSSGSTTARPPRRRRHPLAPASASTPPSPGEAAAGVPGHDVQRGHRPSGGEGQRASSTWRRTGPRCRRSRPSPVVREWSRSPRASTTPATVTRTGTSVTSTRTSCSTPAGPS